MMRFAERSKRTRKEFNWVSAMPINMIHLSRANPLAFEQTILAPRMRSQLRRPDFLSPSLAVVQLLDLGVTRHHVG
jgi:hypothetical protein